MTTALTPRSYRIFGLTLESTLPLPELPPTASPLTDLRFCLADPRATAPVDIVWQHHWIDASDRTSALIGTSGADYVLQFPGVGLFVISSAGERICCHPAPACPVPAVRHLLLDQVIPQVLAHRGDLVAHAGASLVGGGCACFLGRSGAGKSTLVAALGRRGALALADDGVILRPESDAITCIPGYPGARLWPDSLKQLEPDLADGLAWDGAKSRLIPERWDELPAPAQLKALFFLDSEHRGTETIIESITGPDAMIALVQHSFHFDVTDSRHMAQQFNALGQVLAAGPGLFRLVYRRDYSRLDEVCQAVTATVTALGR